MKKIVLAFDSFKGSVGSFEIAKAAEKAIQEELPDCQIIRFPIACLLYTSPSPRDGATSRMPSSA